MNVALMINSLGFGGAERIIADLSVHLEKAGFGVFVFVMSDADIAYPYGGALVRIGLAYRKSSPLMTLLSWQHLVGTAIQKRRHKIDVTISAMEYLNLMNALTGRTRRIATLHNHRFQHEVTPTAKDRFIEWLFSKLARRNSDIVCVSRAIEDKARTLYPGANVRTIYNSCDLARISALLAQPPEGELPQFTRHTLVSAGRLCAQKAQDRLLHAFALVRARCPQARLVLLGSGEKEATLRELAARLGIADAVNFIGFVKNPFYYIHRCRAFVLSSEYEGFGNVIIEAFACGTPVISTDCRSGPREILAPDTPPAREAESVERAEYGILTPLAHEPLAEAMLMLLHDDALHAHYAQKASERAQHFSMSVIIGQWTALLRGAQGLEATTYDAL